MGCRGPGERLAKTAHMCEAEVANISRHGFWLMTAAGERFLAFDEFPWFREAPVAHIVNVEEPSPSHYYTAEPKQ